MKKTSSTTKAAAPKPSLPAGRKTTSAKKTVAAEAQTPAVKKAPAAKKTTKTSTTAVKTSTKKSAPAKKTTAKADTKSIKNSELGKSISKAAASAKKTVKEKIIPEIKNISVPKVTTTPSDGIKILGILHFLGNIFSSGTLGIVLVLIFFFVKNDTLSKVEKETCLEIINFNLSFIIYGIIIALLVASVIGILIAVPLGLVIGITWLVLLILGFLAHLSGKNYQYPFIIRFIK